MSKKTINILLLVISITFSSCQESISTKKEFFKWVNNPGNGLIKKVTVGPLDYQVKYLPPEYLAFDEWEQEQQDGNEVSLKELINEYNKSLTFLFTITPNGTGGNIDIMKAGVNNYEEYTERVHEMNFNMAEYVSLKVDEVTYKPVLTRLENIYGVGKYRNFHIVFAPTIEDSVTIRNGEKFDFTYLDQFHETGINHFTFNKKDIYELPALEFINKNLTIATNENN